MHPRTLAMFGAAAAASLAASATAQEPWIDAGQQAQIMHNGALLEQQTAPGQDNSDKRTRKPALTASCDVDAMKAQLRPEYERRVKSYGRKAADSWLQRTAGDLGRQARANC